MDTQKSPEIPGFFRARLGQIALGQIPAASDKFRGVRIRPDNRGMATSTITNKRRRGQGPAAGASIRADELLPLVELRRRLGWGAHALRQARAAGLRLISFGASKYALGRDVLDFFGRLAEEQDNKRRQQRAEEGEA